MKGNCEDCTFANSFGDTFLTNHYTRKRFQTKGKMYKEKVESYGTKDEPIQWMTFEDPPFLYKSR